MERASEIAVALAVGALLVGMGFGLYVTAPLTADFQSRLLRRPQHGRHWRFVLWWMRAAGVLIIVVTVLVVFLVLAGRW